MSNRHANLGKAVLMLIVCTVRIGADALAVRHTASVQLMESPDEGGRAMSD